MTESIMSFLIVGAVILLALYNKFFRDQGGGRGAEIAPKKVSRWERYAIKYGGRFDIPWQILMAQIWQESSGNPNAIGSAGEVGLMQVKPGAVEDVQKFTNVSTDGWQKDPETNIKVGAAYLMVNLKDGRTAGNFYQALRMYNQGPTGYQGRGREKSIQYANEVKQKAKDLGYVI